MQKELLFTVIAGCAMSFSACNKNSTEQATAETEKAPEKGKNVDEATKKAIVEHYAKLVSLTYQDSLQTAQELEKAINSFLETPSEQGLENAKKAWLVARDPYGKSEVFRFYGGPIDDDNGPEGLLNAWPLDETYIESSNEAVKGIIENVDGLPEMSIEKLVELNEKEGEENISTGYHAIEFLLWGVDTSQDGPGQRPFTDYTSAPFAQRRAQYLRLVTQRLVSDLQYLVDAWKPNEKNYRADFVALPTDKALEHILNGIGMLSGFELARERVDVPLNTMSQEDEHSCFSDNTHNDILYNAISIQNAFDGKYNGVYFNLEEGPSVKLLFDQGDKLSKAMLQSVELAKGLTPPFDQLIIEENKEGRAAIKVLVESLSDQAEQLSEACEQVGLKINIEE